MRLFLRISMRAIYMSGSVLHPWALFLPAFEWQTDIMKIFAFITMNYHELSSAEARRAFHGFLD